MLVRLLGAVELVAFEGWTRAGPAKRSCVLAALAVSPGEPVSLATLADRVWGANPPSSAHSTLYGHIAHLRAQLRGHGDVSIEKSGLDGYLLDVDPEQIDVHAVRSLGRQARDRARAGDVAQALTLWQRAGELVRGEALAGIGGDWAADVRAGFRREHVAMLAERFAVELELGRHAEIVEELSGLVARFPLAESLVGHLMTALYRSGRQAEALDAFGGARARLADRLGADPGSRLQALHRQILNQDPALARDDEAAASSSPAGGGRAPATSGARATTPRQLPADVSGFAGRSAALKALDDFLDEDQISRPVVITAIAGAAGVGKTALAVHWAHRVAAHFPDGQLYVNLKGFDPSGELTTPAEAVRGFLNALAVPKERIPAGLDAQAALYRSSLSGKRVLVVLDNARDAEQVRPLLPGSTGCLAVVTSRHQLFGLVASEGARPVPLDVLADEEARQLIAGRIGADRTAAEPEAVDAIVAACAGLPLALAVAAARAAVSPATTLAELAGQLHDSLDAFGGDDEAVNLRAVFSWSYRTLEAETARLFRLLGLFPGPDVSLPAAASLAGAPVRETRARLAQLRDAHLIVEHVPGRYTLHDLLRTYAWELTRQRDSADDRRAAQRRLFDWLLHTALAAELLINPSRDPIALSAPAAGVVVAPPTEYQSAFDWFDVERTVLLAAVDSAAASGSDDHAWQLAWTLNTFLNYQGYWREWIESQQTALGAATRQSNRPAQARIHCQQSQAVLTQPGTCDEARAHLDAALALYVELDDVAGQGRVHMSLGGLARRMEREEAALEHNLLALERYRAAGYERGAALALNNAGWHHAQLGDLGRAMECCREALDVYEQLDDPHGEAIILDSLGYIRERLGDHRESVACYRSAVEKFRDSGDRYNEAKTLSRLADVCRAADDAAGARDCYKRALDVFEDLGLSDAERIRAELDRLSSDA